jgi:hypothetical protein
LTCGSCGASIPTRAFQKYFRYSCISSLPSILSRLTLPGCLFQLTSLGCLIPPGLYWLCASTVLSQLSLSYSGPPPPHLSYLSRHDFSAPVLLSFVLSWLSFLYGFPAGVPKF